MSEVKTNGKRKSNENLWVENFQLQKCRNYLKTYLGKLFFL